MYVYQQPVKYDDSDEDGADPALHRPKGSGNNSSISSNAAGTAAPASKRAKAKSGAAEKRPLSAYNIHFQRLRAQLREDPEV